MPMSLVKNHCLCGAMHVRSGARVLSIILLVLSAVHLLNTLGFVPNYPCSPFSATFIFIIICTLTYGVFAERRYFLIPFLIMKALFTVATMSVFLAWTAIYVAYGKLITKYTIIPFYGYMETMDTHDGKSNIIICLALAFVTIIFLQIYILKVFLSFYTFLRDRHQAVLTDSDESHEYSPVSTSSV
ncbi:unnamed protein product [Cylicocyclus nassatus]|uniref:Uncharacterized protein n=1 Tax=Cylicocyclus nassatus TaxID=53992 RepID=A0AA36MAV7_CYLNA|nr:unnamed protein product [Cylicocyclus nassatus]